MGRLLLPCFRCQEPTLKSKLKEHLILSHKLAHDAAEAENQRVRAWVNASYEDNIIIMWETLLKMAPAGMDPVELKGVLEKCGHIVTHPNSFVLSQ